MFDIFKDAFIDALKLLPYLFITFLLLEFIEHKLSDKNEKILVKNKKIGPVFGGLLGGLPQCGFSSMASSLFSAKVITMGTLIAIFLSTSDEMIPIMISEKVSFLLVFKIVLFKVIIGIIIGYIIDAFYFSKSTSKISELCEHDHCACKEDGVFLSSIKHTIKIGLFILIINYLLNYIIFKIGDNNLTNLLLHHNAFSYLIASLIGLIPNCAGSVLITELYLSKLISLGTMLSGLLTGSGMGILILFKTNKNIKENLSILTIVYFIGAIVGAIIDLVI